MHILFQFAAKASAVVHILFQFAARASAVVHILFQFAAKASAVVHILFQTALTQILAYTNFTLGFPPLGVWWVRALMCGVAAPRDRSLDCLTFVFCHF